MPRNRPRPRPANSPAAPRSTRTALRRAAEVAVQQYDGRLERCIGPHLGEAPPRPHVRSRGIAGVGDPSWHRPFASQALACLVLDEDGNEVADRVAVELEVLLTHDGRDGVAGPLRESGGG